MRSCRRIAGLAEVARKQGPIGLEKVEIEDPFLAKGIRFVATTDQANSVHQVLEAEGVPSGDIFMVAGKADTDPLFPDDPSMSPNRRVTITLIREEPPLPGDLAP